jgi:hypothetical protein
VTVSNGASVVLTVMANAPGIAHVILAVTDNGTPALTSGRHVILTIQNRPAGASARPLQPPGVSR